MKFYKGITPNTEFSENFIGSKKAFIDYLNAFKFYEVASNQQNYVIYDTIRIKNVSPIREAAFDISYIYDELTNYFYHVRSCTILKDSIIFNVSRDTWANEVMEHAKDIKNIQVKKSNKNIGTGIYDNIIKLEPFKEHEELQTFNLENWSIVFVAVYDRVIKTTTPFATVPNVSTFVLPYKTIKSEWDKEDQLQRPDIISYGINMVSSMATYEQGADKPNAVEGKFNVIKAYFIDNSFIKPWIYQFKVFYFYERKKPVYIMQCSSWDDLKIFDIPNTPSYNFYFGTKYANLKLTRFNTNNLRVYLRCITKQDGISIIVQQGENELDITNAFEINITTIEGSLTAQQKIGDAISALSGVLSTSSNIAKGSYGDAALSAGRTIQHFVYGGSNGSYIRGGDGLNTFLNYGSITSPYILTKIKSYDDERKNAAYNGIMFDEFVPDLQTILNSEDIKEKTIFKDAPTFIIGNAAILEGFTLDTQNLINSRLQQGLKVKVLNG